MTRVNIEMDAGAATGEPHHSRRLGTLALILLTALSVRVYRAETLGSISRDGVFLVTFAKQLADDPAFYIKAQKKQPGYSAMLLATHKVIGPQMATDAPTQWERCGQGIAILGGVTAVAMIFVFARTLFSIEAAVVAGAVAAFWPNHVAVSADVLTDAPHLALYLLALWVGFRALEKNYHLPTLAACGALAGLAYWIRQEALGVPLAVALFLLLARNDRLLKQRVIGCACLFAAFAVVVAPLVLITGTLMHNKSIWEMLTGKQAEVVSWSTDLSVAALVSPWSAPGRMFIAWCESGRYVISFWTIVALIWPAVRPAHARLGRLVAIAILLQLAATQLRGARHGEISQRYLMIPVALSIPWAAEALRQAAIALRRLMHGRPPQLIRFAAVFGTPRQRAPWAGLCIIALLLLPMIWFCLRPTRAGADAPRLAGRWLAAHAQPGDRILTPREMSPVCFYADLPHEWPFDPINQPVPVMPARWFVDRLRGSALPPAQQEFLNMLRQRVAGERPTADFSLPGGDSIQIYAITNRQISR